MSRSVTWLYVAHLGTPEEALSDMRKIVPGDSLIAITDDHDFLYKDEAGIGGLLIAAELDTEQKAKSCGDRITPLRDGHEKIWKWEISDRAPGARRD